MSTLTERSNIIALVDQAIQGGARQDRACRAISLSERTLQRWQRDQSRGDQRPIRLQEPKNALSAQQRQAVQWPSQRSSAICAPARSFPAWPTRGSTSPLKQRFTASSEPQTSSTTVGPSGPVQSAASRVHCLPRGPDSCSVGTHHVLAHPGGGELLLPVPVSGHF
jgi:hypothetical protein